MAITNFIPGGIVYVLQGVNLNNSYTDTYTFSGIGQQQNFFIEKSIYSTGHFTPVREGRAIRVPVNSNVICQADYIMYQNTNYNNKWWYAFITSIDWVNINECQISYEIDVIQTWYFDYVFPQMFIEREHVNDDSIGANLINEGLETGEWIVADTTKTDLFSDMEYVVWATVNKTGGAEPGNIYGGIYSGLKRNSFTTASEVNNFISSLVTAGKGDAIVSINMVPVGFDAEGDYIATVKNFTVTPNIPSGSTKPTLDGYLPVNNKLYTYPYNFLKVTTHNGNAGIFRYEYFNLNKSDTAIVFHISLDDCPNPTAVCIPENYLGYMLFPGDGDQQLTINSFPQCAWASDTYQAWLAQNSNVLQFQTESTIINAAAQLGPAIVDGNVLGMVNTGVQAYLSIKNAMAIKEDKSILPPQSHGSQSGYIQTALQIQDFFFQKMTITREFAKSIDGYFSMFGYAVHQVKVPNIKGRTSYNYVKTQNATVLGKAPATAKAKMENILNNGVRFWHGDYIGQYFRANTIVPSAFETFDKQQMIDLTGTTVINLPYKE